MMNCEPGVLYLQLKGLTGFPAVFTSILIAQLQNLKFGSFSEFKLLDYDGLSILFIYLFEHVKIICVYTN